MFPLDINQPSQQVDSDGVIGRLQVKDDISLPLYIVEECVLHFLFFFFPLKREHQSYVLASVLFVFLGAGASS